MPSARSVAPFGHDARAGTAPTAIRFLSRSKGISTRVLLSLRKTRYPLSDITHRGHGGLSLTSCPQFLMESRGSWRSF